MLCRCVVWSSIVSTNIAFGNKCSAKNGTFGTLQMLLSQEVDAIFGPICSSGELTTKDVIDTLQNSQN